MVEMNKKQFKKRLKKDPTADDTGKKPRFPATDSKTMPVKKGMGLHKGPDKHPHHSKNSRRSRKPR